MLLGVLYIIVELMVYFIVNGLKWIKIDIFVVLFKFVKLNFKEKENIKKYYIVFLCRLFEICNSWLNIYVIGKVWLDWGWGRFFYIWW